MKLLEQMQQKIKMKGLSPKTFETYAQHCEDFFRFLLKRFGAWKHPKDVGRPEIGILCRWHRDEDHIGRQISQASKRAGIMTRVTSHILRHSYATHAHEQGVPMRTLMELLGHSDIRTTEIYVHADQHQATSAKSPLEALLANPQLVAEHRKSEEKPTLRIFAG